MAEEKESFWQKHGTKVRVTLGFVAGGVVMYILGSNMSNIRIDGTGNIVAGRDMITHNHAPKRLSYIVTDGERWWDTQASAAKDLGERASDISNHLNHGADLKSGAVLERKGVRS